MEICFVLLMLLFHQSFGIIYRLNEEEYEQMPPLNYVDDYDGCFQDPDALYCTMKLKLVSDTPNDLMDLIGNYSEWDITHFDHSKLYRGVCVTKTCNTSKQEISMNLNNSLELCLNKSLWKDYKLKAKLLTAPECYTKNKNIKLDSWDIIVGSFCALIIIVNIVVTIYDLYANKKPDHKGMDILLSFSILRNWTRLRQNDYRIKGPTAILKGIDGIRAIIMISFVFGHSILPFATIIANTHDFENMYYNTSCHILLNGSLLVQAYFAMGGILLSYNMKRLAERSKMNWITITKHVFKRWLRLTPSFVIFLSIISSWMRHLGAGPVWQLIETNEIEDCRRYGMWNFFYLANYKTGSHCMPHTWYLAADMHLYCFGIALFVLVSSNYWRRIIMASAFLIGIISSGLITFLYDFRSLCAVKPNSLIDFFVKDANFDYLYKPTHANIQSYVIGLSTGVLIYRLQKSNFDIQKYKKFVVLYWMLIPSIIGILILCRVNYMDGPPHPLYVRVVFQMLIRPLLAVIFAVGIFGMAFKLENIYRGLCEWDGWIWVARVSYTTYMTHFTIMRYIVGNSKTLNYFSKYILVQAAGITAISFVVGVIVWLLIDGPVSHIVKICMETAPKRHSTKEK